VAAADRIDRASVSDTHVMFDREWRYIYVNDAAVWALGRPRERIIGDGTEIDRH